jgi:hypothetical protein
VEKVAQNAFLAMKRRADFMSLAKKNSGREIPHRTCRKYLAQKIPHKGELTDQVNDEDASQQKDHRSVPRSRRHLHLSRRRSGRGQGHDERRQWVAKDNDLHVA